MSKRERYFDVDVRKVDIGHIIVKAGNKEEAMKKILTNDFVAIKSEFWNSISLTPLNAQIAECVPSRLLQSEEEEFIY